MKRKLSLFSCLCLFFFVIFSSKAQEIAPFQWNDTFALEIGEAVLEKLLNKIWVCTERQFTVKDRVYGNKPFYTNLLLMENGICNHNDFEGSWFIEENGLFVMDYKPELMNKEQMFIAGGFSIYKITKDELIIVKNLTSSYDNKIIYYFRPESEAEILAKMEKESREKRRKELGKETDPSLPEKIKRETIDEMLAIEYKLKMLESKTTEEVIGEIKAEAFMRGIKIQKKLDLMTREELKTFYIEILNK